MGNRIGAYTSILGPHSRPGVGRQEGDQPSPNPSFFGVVRGLLRSPQRLLLLWNWKSALLSLILRGPIFLIASIHRGIEAAAAALLTESVFCVLTAGFWGAIVQALRNAEPEWLTAIFLLVVMPAAFQVLEYWLHWIRGTPHLRPAEIASVVMSAISALFNWYAMRRGTLLVGAEGRALGADLRRLPRLILAFLAELPRSIARILAGESRFARRGGNECL